jgi:hypothetical protein
MKVERNVESVIPQEFHNRLGAVDGRETTHWQHFGQTGQADKNKVRSFFFPAGV